MTEFNLIEESWIPCITTHGQRVEYGIRDTLLKAHELREICDDSPLVTVALHRLLLAILYRTFKGPQDMAQWRSLFSRCHFSQSNEIDKYLNYWHNRFYLFDEKYPFMQIANLDLNEFKKDDIIINDKSDGLMRLVREAPDKGGRILFDHRVGTERPDYEPKQIVKMVLSAQSYSGTGVASAGKVGNQQIIPSPCQFAPCVEGLVLWFQGESLFHTLLLNLVPHDHVINDKPAWEDDSIVYTAVRSWKNPIIFAGPVQRFASLSRFLLVIDRKSMFFTNGVKTSADSDDPMKAYSQSEKKDAYQAVKLYKDRAAWRDAHTLFSLGSPARKSPASLNHLARLVRDGIFATTAQPRANLVGLATDKGKALLWRHERMPIPATLLADGNMIEQLGKLLQDAEQAAINLKDRTRRIAKLYLSPNSESPKGRQPDKDEVTRVVEAIDPRPAYWARLEKNFFALLENLSNDWDTANDDWKPVHQQEATNTWRKQVKSEARRALEESIRSFGTTARAIQAIARVRTDFNDDDLMPQQQKVAKENRKSKGGKKQ